MADDLGRAGPRAAAVGGAVHTLLVHGEDGHLGGGLHAALGVGGLAGEPAPVLGEHLVDGDRGRAVLVLDLHDLVGGDGLAVLEPGHLRVGVPLDLHLQLEPRAVLDLELGLEAGEEGGGAHQRVVRGQRQLLGVAAGPRPAHRVGRVGSKHGEV